MAVPLNTFIRREAPKAHKHTMPTWRWLPWLVVPRWKDGALWRCECNKVYEWRWVEFPGRDHDETNGYSMWVEMDQ